MVTHSNCQRREALMNFPPQGQSILVVRCCSIKTQLKNVFLFIEWQNKVYQISVVSSTRQVVVVFGWWWCCWGQIGHTRTLFVCGGPWGRSGNASAFTLKSHAVWWVLVLLFPLPSCGSLANEVKRRRNVWMRGSCKCPQWRWHAQCFCTASELGVVATQGRAGLASSREQMWKLQCLEHAFLSHAKLVTSC